MNNSSNPQISTVVNPNTNADKKEDTVMSRKLMMLLENNNDLIMKQNYQHIIIYGMPLKQLREIYNLKRYVRKESTER